MTSRAVCIGLFASIGITLVIGYNDWYLGNTLLIGNHFPFISLVVLVALALGVNVAARRWFGAAGLSGGELMLVWGMIGVAGGIASAGMMRYFPSWMAAPAYLASSTNEFPEHVLRYLPDWMVVSRDPDSPAIRWFMEGLPKGQSIPWGDWVVPFAAWSSFALLIFGASFSLVSLFFRQWSVKERLIFPVIHLPVEVAREAPPGRLLNSFLRNRLTWAGAAIPAAIWGLNGLSSYFPGVLTIPMGWGTYGLFADRPWSAFNMETAHVYFTMIGIVFLLTTEVSFSLWFIYFLYRLSFVGVDYLGAAGSGFWSEWSWRVPTFEVTGCFVVLAAFLFWTARESLGRWMRRVRTGRGDPEEDPMHPRLTMALIVLGFLGMIAWFMFAGAAWWAAALAVLFFLAMLLVLTRIISEAGLIFLQCGVISYDVLTGLVPASWFGGFTLGSLMMQKGIFMHDHREIFMPYAMNGLRGATEFRVRPGKVVAVFAVTAVVALGVSAYAKVSTCYKYGGVHMDVWANIMAPDWFIGGMVKYRKSPPAYDWVKAGEWKVVPVNVAHMLTGGGIATGLLVLRARFPWWPVHPFGMIMCAPYTLNKFWFSIFLGWVAKSCVLKLGGGGAYRRILPFFLGLVLGESLIAAFWMLLGLITGTPSIAILPS